MIRGPTLALCALVAMFVALLALPPRGALGASYVVDTTADDPGIALTSCTGAAANCSLRGAITNANAASTPGDTITFDPTIFPGGAPATIAIASTLPSLTGGGDSIDGTAAGVIVSATGIFTCLNISSAGNSVMKLQWRRCGGSGIALSSPTSDNNIVGPGNVFLGSDLATGELGVFVSEFATGNVIIGNFVGTNAAGTANAPEGGNTVGIYISGANNLVGGVNPADRNIISGNGSGIYIEGANASGNTVEGNYIGTNVTGTSDLGNSFAGISILGGASSNTIGGLGAGEGNLISGNNNDAVSISSGNSNAVLGNILGPDINGSGAAMSGNIGASIAAGALNNTVGPGNVISDMNFVGVYIKDAGTTGNIIKGNRIGTNLSGTAGVPNASGVVITLAATANLVGGTTPGDGNTIAFNTSDGVRVENAGTTGNSLRTNSIHDNTGLEINNVSGGNNELTPPSITGAGSAAVTGTACGGCVVDIFSDGASDAEFYEGSVTAAGDGSFVLVTSIAASMVTATSTDGGGNTSELSAAAAFSDSDSDGFPNSLDNCPATANGPAQAGVLGVGNQTDSDGDAIPGTQPPANGTFGGDACDVDDDNDQVPDSSEFGACRILAEDYDGFQDTDGCPDPDNDLDGICDAGQASTSCTGSDSGKTAFFATGHNHTNPTIDCRNTPEDFDAFKDGDGCAEPDNDNDGVNDGDDQCDGDDNLAGADGVLGSGEDQNHNGILNSGEDTVVVDGVLTTDDSVLTFEDYDGVLDNDGCHDSPGDDRDGDGFTDENEVLKIGTRADKACGGDSWPADLLSTGNSANKLDLQDLASFIAPVRRLGTSPADGNFSARWDLIPGAVIGKFINLQDMAALVPSNVSATARPPMFAGTPAFGKVCPVPP